MGRFVPTKVNVPPTVARGVSVLILMSVERMVTVMKVNSAVILFQVKEHVKQCNLKDKSAHVRNNVIPSVALSGFVRRRMTVVPMLIAVPTNIVVIPYRAKENAKTYYPKERLVQKICNVPRINVLSSFVSS
jgi:hypothetical protein